MENTSIGTAPSNLASSFTEDSPSKSAGIAFCSALALEAVLITGGNLLTVVLFALNRNLYTVSNILNFPNSLLNPVVYALRIPEFREAMGICRLKRTAVINMDNNTDNKRQDTRATGMTSLTQPSALTTDPCRLNIAYEQDREGIMDTKL